ncbi:MAG: HlyD family efflux transporter periplasmic adaptor subunit [Pirellulales bacterium]|nr:HlyD family efflux transporter periplasmic adaptor subunit [Pirellulales bacterium]
MRPRLRPQIEIVRTAPDHFLARDRETGDFLELGIDERYLLACCDGEHTLADMAARFHARFGREIPPRYLREFVEQLLVQGLVVDVDAKQQRLEIVSPAPAHVAGPTLPPPAPFSNDDLHGRLNHRFDLLALFFGWLVHPLMAVPVLLLTMCAAMILFQHYNRLERASILLHRRFSLQEVIVIWLAASVTVLGMPTAILKGMACRVFGGIVTSFRLHFHRGLIPYFKCDLGESFFVMDERARWTLLSLGIWVRLAFGSLALVTWTIVDPGSELSSYCLIIAGPALAGLLLRLNPLAPLDGYALLCYACEVPQLEDRAKHETRAWLFGRVAPEALPPRTRFWFRVYGLLHDAWLVWVHLFLIGLGGLILTRGFGAGGAMVVLVLVVWWYHSEIGRFLMSFSAIRWLVRGGGHWYIRWPVRLVLLAAVVACGFLPYDHEIGGDVRLVPTTEVGIRAQTAGEVTELALAEGNRVDTDDVLVRLSGRRQRAEVDRTRAQLAEAQAKLDLLKAGTRPEEIEIARHRVEMAKHRASYTTEEYNRIEKLASSQTISDAELQNAVFDRDQAQEILKAAQEELAKLTSGSRDEEIRAAEAQVAQTQASLSHHESELKMIDIRSPIRGEIVTAHLDRRRGHHVEPGDLIAIVQDDSVLRAEIAATEDAAIYIKSGQPVKIRLWGTNGELITGRVTGVSTVALDAGELNARRVRTDRENLGQSTLHPTAAHYVRVYAEIDRPSYTLATDMTGYARIKIGPDYFWNALARPIVRFVRVEMWSWLP